MAKIHNLGFPRIGPERELKKELETYWRGEISGNELVGRSESLWLQNLQRQACLDVVQVGDFSLYDHVLDTSFLFGVVPERVRRESDDPLQQYFLNARGTRTDSTCCGASAGEMTKWFNTNYHYIVPELVAGQSFRLQAQSLLHQVTLTRQAGFDAKPVVVGPLTYLSLAKCEEGVSALTHLDNLLRVYKELLSLLAQKGVEWVQVDEPILCTDLSAEWKMAFRYAYEVLRHAPGKRLLTTYFGKLQDNLSLVTELPVEGIHIDATLHREELPAIVDSLADEQVLSLGVIDGRNVWRAPIAETASWLSPYHDKLQNRLWLAPTCSLLHVPLTVKAETELPDAITSRLAFAEEKIDELAELRTLLHSHNHDSGVSGQRNNVSTPLLIDDANAPVLFRDASFTSRRTTQAKALNLPPWTTTTIGSFPQTPAIRKARAQWRSGKLNHSEYQAFIKQQIAECIRTQEQLGLDVLVHGEAERNDMVEFFGELLDGVVILKNGWVQSYGSRCVKPPVIYADVTRSSPMTVALTSYAQSLTSKPVKGMLTGPVTILNWSFVRDDISRAEVAQQLAFAIRDEVLALEAAGIRIIQVDEAALREGMPLRKAEADDYLNWAVNAFRLATSGVRNETQIHTHMCYSDFNNIIDAIMKMDADVLTIEAARSGLKVLSALKAHGYQNSIGPGVYDIHSPAIPDENALAQRLHTFAEFLDQQQLWVNPDCGLKTRSWHEASRALGAMVSAADRIRKQSAKA
ncbi:5-methyltetrahydropteroyltriglutamate--homocysteine S-methyltransferase [Alteromonas sp. H39]|uniref:5-methyltetrahydropteroyltriglutamate-- homocysteine S-methyltransferase n=1 Tax=Alteromonas sp. H39 TaxID=3389876 RepID=UPI0039E0BBDD